MKVSSVAIPPMENRPASRILHNDDATRIVSFTVDEGQSIPPHVSPGTVTLLVLEGTGIFTGGNDETAELRAGDMITYEPNEAHGISSRGALLRFVAYIATPGGR